MEKLKILVIDDEKAITSSMVYYFSKRGYDARGVSDPEEALVHIAEGGYDAVITDLQMSPVSGFEIIDIMRNRSPKTLLIAMSGKFTKEDVGGLDVDFFFEKPFLYKDVEEVIKERLAMGKTA